MPPHARGTTWSTTQRGQGPDGLPVLGHRLAITESFGDWTDPPSPLDELQRRAFAADQIEPDAAALWLSEDLTLASQTERPFADWQELVVERFVQRYRLWC